MQFPLPGMPPPPILQLLVPGSHALGGLLALTLDKVMTSALLPRCIVQTTSALAFPGLHRHSPLYVCPSYGAGSSWGQLALSQSLQHPAQFLVCSGTSQERLLNEHVVVPP